MSATALLLLEIIDLCKVAALVLTAPTLLIARRLKRHPGPLHRSFGAAVAMLIFFACFLSYAVGTGSCVLGGVIEGQAICGMSSKNRGALHPVNDFIQIQFLYACVFVITAVFASLTALWFPAGPATPWQRWVFVVTLGRSGQWR